MAGRDELIEIFEDTKKWYETDAGLKAAVKASIEGTEIWHEGKMPALPELKPYEKTLVSVSALRSYDAAMKMHNESPDERIAVHNFASATNLGGGVTRGSRAQEESLCRCSTLYPVLNTKANWDDFYEFHRSRHDVRYTDACIYTPKIQIIKSDTDLPARLPKEQWCEVDVLTCAAPNLRPRPNNAMNPGNDNPIRITDKELLNLHIERARHLMQIAAAKGDTALILGAFGCGAFQNDPEIVADAYKETLKEFDGYFSKIEFAVYCGPKDDTNYRTFSRVLSS